MEYKLSLGRNRAICQQDMYVCNKLVAQSQLVNSLLEQFLTRV